MYSLIFLVYYYIFLAINNLYFFRSYYNILCIVQDHNHNTGIWSNIESATRYLAKKEGSLYVITGPIYKGTLKSIGNGVLVPTYIYKIIYSPKQQKAAVYFTNNEPGKNYHVISVKELELLSGINFFPKMSEEKKTQLLTLPEPKAQK